MTRRKCQFPGCSNPGRNKGIYKNKRRYDRFCEHHHRMRYAERTTYWEGKRSIKNDRCELCGWDKAPCDRHRIDPKKGYFAENVKVLCPNCHRLITLNVIELS